MVSVGLLYKLAAATYFIGFSYLFLIDATHYLNHFYLIIVFLFLLMFIPVRLGELLESATESLRSSHTDCVQANTSGSLDCWIWPEIYSAKMPRWVLYVLRFEQVLVYFYAGIAKINEDWLRASPLGEWIAIRASKYPDLHVRFIQFDQTRTELNPNRIGSSRTNGI